MVITVQCPECSTSFPVDPAKIPWGGVKVRCSICAAVFRVERPEEAAARAARDISRGAEPAPAVEAPVREEPGEPEAGATVEETLQPEAEASPESVPAFEAPVPEEPAEPVPEEHEADAAVDGTLQPEAEASPESVPAFEAPVSEEPEAGATVEETRPPEAGLDHQAPATEGSADAEVPALTRPPESAHEWVFETEDHIDAGDLEIEPVGTVEEAMDEARDSFTGDSMVQTGADVLEGTAPPVEEAPPEARPALAPEPEPEPTVETPPPPPGPATTQPVTGFTFGKRDPHDKARRLARVLVSDIITYNPDRHQRALTRGTLKEDFDDEIQKSWREYVEQVGKEIASGTTYWTDALNDVLAQGRRVF